MEQPRRDAGRGLPYPRRPAHGRRDPARLGAGRQAGGLGRVFQLPGLAAGLCRPGPGHGLVCAPRTPAGRGAAVGTHLGRASRSSSWPRSTSTPTRAASWTTAANTVSRCGILGYFKEQRRDAPDEAWACPPLGPRQGAPAGRRRAHPALLQRRHVARRIGQFDQRVPQRRFGTVAQRIRVQRAHRTKRRGD